MLQRFAVLLACAALAAGAAQAEMRRDGARSARPAPMGDVTRSVPARPPRSPHAGRCANFRAEVRDARRAEREAITTTQRDQAAARYWQTEQARQKAGC
ncbi:MAG TPA: hypothetical protein VF211_05790 [Burkholderiales bacterium]